MVSDWIGGTCNFYAPTVSLTATFRFSFTIRPAPAFTSLAVSKRHAHKDLVISAGGNHWEYQSKSEIKGKTVQFHTINKFRNPDSVEWWSEHSTDAGQHWTGMGRGSGKGENESPGGRAERETRLDWFR